MSLKMRWTDAVSILGRTFRQSSCMTVSIMFGSPDLIVLGKLFDILLNCCDLFTDFESRDQFSNGFLPSILLDSLFILRPKFDFTFSPGDSGSFTRQQLGFHGFIGKRQMFANQLVPQSMEIVFFVLLAYCNLLCQPFADVPHRGKVQLGRFTDA